MTREDAISWLEKIKIKYIHGGDEEFDAQRIKALDMAISALREQISPEKTAKSSDEKQATSGWINVKERLPEINTKVLVRYKHTGKPHKRSTAFDYLRVSSMNPTVFNWMQHPCRVTHWMPLPEAPKEEV